jgi:hypothetical protein
VFVVELVELLPVEVARVDELQAVVGVGAVEPLPVFVIRPG